jgi:hypothetical protein
MVATIKSRFKMDLDFIKKDLHLQDRHMICLDVDAYISDYIKRSCLKPITITGKPYLRYDFNRKYVYMEIYLEKNKKLSDTLYYMSNANENYPVDSFRLMDYKHDELQSNISVKISGITPDMSGDLIANNAKDDFIRISQWLTIKNNVIYEETAKFYRLAKPILQEKKAFVQDYIIRSRSLFDDMKNSVGLFHSMNFLLFEPEEKRRKLMAMTYGDLLNR